MLVHEIRHFLTPDGKDIYSAWHRKLRDTQARIATFSPGDMGVSKD